MKVIKNRFFRLGIYILGFLCVITLALYGAASILKYSYFTEETNMSTSYEESATLKKDINKSLQSIQKSADAENGLYQIDLGDKKLEIFDYSDLCENLNSNKKTDSEEYSIEELLGEKNRYGQLAEYVSQYGGGMESVYTAYSESNYSKDGRYVRLTWDEYIDIVKYNCTKYTDEQYTKYLDGTMSEDDKRKEYDKLFENLPEQWIQENDYFGFIDDNLYMFQPGMGLIYYAPLGETMISNDIPMNEYVYFPYVDSLEDITDEKELDQYILSAYIYRTDVEAVYSVLDDDIRKEFQKSSNINTHYSDNYTYGTNTAYSLNGEDVNHAWIYDCERITNISQDSDNGYNVSYPQLCKIYETEADIFIRYDAESGKLEQWYKNENGEKKNYEYISADVLDGLTKTVNESFVVCINDTADTCQHLWYKTAYNYTRHFSNPLLCFTFSFVVFLVCVVILVVGEPAKMYKVDKVPYLLWFMVYAGVISAFCMILAEIAYGVTRISIVSHDMPGLIAVTALCLLVLYLISAAVVMNIVRRVKCNKFLDGFIIIKFARWIHRKFKVARDRIAGNKKLVAFMVAYFIVMLAVLIFLSSMSQVGFVVILAPIMAVVTGVCSFFIFKYMTDVDKLLETSRRIEAGELDAKVDVSALKFNTREMGESLNNLGAGLSQAVESSLRDEKTKAELITNVSHDIKTPLTSIINYVDLLKKEEIENDKAKEYIDVLDQKSQRLKQLILDLIEASKTSTGNIELECMNMNLVELLNQGLGEYEDKFNEAGLEIVKDFKVDSAVINADGRRVFRIIDNLLNNVVKYAQQGTRVYIDLNVDDLADSNNVRLSIKNISRASLNITAEELTERFVRGDRSRNTEGSGLGLSIAKNLTELQNGTFDIKIDGDLFKVEVVFPVVG